MINVSIAAEYIVGALAATINNRTEVINCSATGSLTATMSAIGGLIGSSINSTVVESFTAGNVAAYSPGHSGVGGLVGSISNTLLFNCYSSSVVNGINGLGGLAGTSNNSSIVNSYSSGNVNGSGNYIGGLSGHNINVVLKGQFTICTMSGSI